MPGDAENATKQDLRDLEGRLAEAIHDSETRILKALYGYTQTVDLRLTENKMHQESLEKRVLVLESRILEVEKRVNFPPPRGPAN